MATTFMPNHDMLEWGISGGILRVGVRNALPLKIQLIYPKIPIKHSNRAILQ